MSDRPYESDRLDEAEAQPICDLSYTTPRWVKAFGVAAVVVVLLVVVLHLSGVGGMPGPGLHTIPAEQGLQRP
ncbi:MAG: hypothetical protein IT305_24430 [Chloroflexi bacterium]|nr:hypothetical protein [Chloroflexota bacterium]